ncbi:response regulator transcription factor [soil metagenome]
MAKLLVVDDDTELAENTKTWLMQSENHQVDCSYNAEDAEQMLSQFHYDLLIFDWQMPGMSGIELCKKIRAAGVHTPILFLTGRTAMEDLETGLESGGDDYLKKPFHLRELSARCRALLRRPEAIQELTAQSDNIKLEVEHRILKVFGTDIALTRLECALVEYLLRNPNRTFSAADILKGIYRADKESSEEAVRALVKGLRKKLASCGEPKAAELLTTIPGAGYCLKS